MLPLLRVLNTRCARNAQLVNLNCRIFVVFFEHFFRMFPLVFLVVVGLNCLLCLCFAGFELLFLLAVPS